MVSAARAGNLLHIRFMHHASAAAARFNPAFNSALGYY